MKLISEDSLAIITIWQEAQGEEFNGKVAVGEVIRNRMKRKYSSDGTVPGTVARRYQFSGWNDDRQSNQLLIASLKLDDTNAIVQDCIKAWEQSKTTNLTKGAVLYCNLKAVDRIPSWARMETLLAVVGNHHFYKD